MKNIRKRIACILLLVFCISNVASVLAASEPHRDQKTQSTILQATVAAASASYYVEIPEDISLGTLNSGHDMNYDYTVRVTMENKKDTDQVTVSSEDQISLRLSEKNLEKETDLLPCYNNFKTHTFTKSESAEGRLTIHKEDIAKVSPGKYAGILNFYIRYQKKGPTPQEPDKPVIPEPSSPTVPETQPPTPQPPDQNPEPDGGIRYSCDVSMRKGTDFSSASMCNPLFYPKADIVCKDEKATLTLYVIDPVPNFASVGTPVSNVTFYYKGQSYGASLRNNSKVMKSFSLAPGFIPKAGEYAATPITVEIPMQAIKESLDKKLTCSAYVNAVVQSTQTFYVVLSNLVQVSKPEENKPEENGNSNIAKPAAKPVTKPTMKPTTKPVISQQQQPGGTASNSETFPTGVGVPEQVQEQTHRYRIVTQLFPPLLGFVLFTALVMGGAFWALWLRRFHR